MSQLDSTVHRKVERLDLITWLKLKCWIAYLKVKFWSKADFLQKTVIQQNLMIPPSLTANKKSFTGPLTRSQVMHCPAISDLPVWTQTCMYPALGTGAWCSQGITALERAASWTVQGHGDKGRNQISGTAVALH